MTRRRRGAGLLGFAALIASPEATSQPEGVAGLREVFPGVRVDVERRLVEFDGVVPIVADAPDAGVVFLEVIACIPDTKEHETLVVTPARPSHIHAALLMIGLEPGAPGGWEWEDETLVPIQPKGDEVAVEFVWTDDLGVEQAAPAWRWVKNDVTGEPLPAKKWLFAGSRMVEWRGEEFYDADGTGVLIGLTTFGSETLAYPILYNPEAAIEEPVWIADAERVPPLDTPVTVRLTPAE